MNKYQPRAGRREYLPSRYRPGAADPDRPLFPRGCPGELQDLAFVPSGRTDADDRLIFAEQIGPRSEIEQWMYRRKQSILARHVVSGRRYRTERRAAQYKIVAAQPDEVWEI